MTSSILHLATKSLLKRRMKIRPLSPRLDIGLELLPFPDNETHCPIIARLQAVQDASLIQVGFNSRAELGRVVYTPPSASCDDLEECLLCRWRVAMSVRPNYWQTGYENNKMKRDEMRTLLDCGVISVLQVTGGLRARSSSVRVSRIYHNLQWWDSCSLNCWTVIKRSRQIQTCSAGILWADVCLEKVNTGKEGIWIPAAIMSWRRVHSTRWWTFSTASWTCKPCRSTGFKSVLSLFLPKKDDL